MLKSLTAAGYAAGRVEEERGRQLPAPDSGAMSELHQQSAFAGVWDENPIDTAQTHIGLLLTAGEDAMDTFASAIVADGTPLYSYIPIARAGMECLALAHWLAEPGIGARERMRRSINERIASAYEQSRLPASLNPEPIGNAGSSPPSRSASARPPASGSSPCSLLTDHRSPSTSNGPSATTNSGRSFTRTRRPSRTGPSGDRRNGRNRSRRTRRPLSLRQRSPSLRRTSR